MQPIIILSIIFSVVLLLIAVGIPFIMSLLDPHNIPTNLVNYYKKKKVWATIIACIIAVVLIASIWGYVLGFAIK